MGNPIHSQIYYQKTQYQIQCSGHIFLIPAEPTCPLKYKRINFDNDHVIERTTDELWLCSRQGRRDFSLLQNFEKASDAHPTAYSIGEKD